MSVKTRVVILISIFIAMNIFGFACTSKISALYGFNASAASTATGTVTSPNQGPVGTAPTGPGRVWVIRPDGGTRYTSARISAGLSGQCDGLADAAYPGSGTNQHCAFNDYRFLYDDQTYGNSTWVISGGDTVFIRGCAAGPNSNAPDCRIGFDTNTGTNWCHGGQGPYSCTNPTIPSGTATQHTRILGQNFAACSTAGTINQSQLTQLFGGYGVGETLNLAGAQFVDVECLELTRHSQCVMTNSYPLAIAPFPAYPSQCNEGNPGQANLDDYVSNGVITDTNTRDLLMQDLWIHGNTGAGLKGPIGGAITMSRMLISFNGGAGWNFDDNSDTADAPGSSISASYVTMLGNGCNQEYPANPAHTFGAISCYDLNSDGFGDSWSGQDTALVSFTCDHCVQAYNTKDGFIGPHTVIGSLVITNSASYGNMGQQWKWNTAANSTTVFENNLTIGNCNRLSQPLTGAPSNYNQYLSDFCRASGDIFSFGSDANSQVLFANNTTVGYSDTIFDVHCNTAGNCGSTPFVFRNNINLAFANPACNNGGCNSSETSNVYYISDTSAMLTGDHNLYYNLRYGCPSGLPSGTCADPAFVNEPPLTMTSESLLDNFNFILSPSSPALGAGVAIPGLTVDAAGRAYTNPPNIGAY